MPAILTILSLVCTLGSIVCWIMTLIVMFKDEKNGGAVKGILGIFCGLWALIWGWMTAAEHNRKQIMMIWTGLILANIVLQVLAAGSAMSGAGGQ